MAERYGPYRNARFTLQIDGIDIAGFSECSVSDNSTDPIEYREGTDPPTVRKLWSLNNYGTLTLKRGTTETKALFEWRRTVERGEMDDARRSISVIVMDEEGENAATWSFVRAWPSRYDAPELNATGTDVAIETLEITHEGMERVA